MRHRTDRLCAAAALASVALAPVALAAVLLGSAGTAEAGCTRHIYNRSGLLLSVSQDGGPAYTLLPGRSMPVRLAQPGSLALSASCGTAGGPVTQIRLDYEAVIDRCYIKIGDGFFEPQLGPGFVGTRDTLPFAVNNPKQGDVVLGPAASASCPVLARRG
ncbi:hypothetical protein [Methylobacterium nigriterrae]|uniref:hypothetical protein n=1 Tax=Methylobacterium nigriterrae TaxID=3127512 RepID=UPI003013DC4D